jgi:hypothetical protein
MYKLSVAVSLLLLTFALPHFWAQSASSPELPAGPMQAKATTACNECHDARIILQQRLSKATWTKELDKMIKWGALVDPQDRDALIDYLSANFSVDKPEYVPERSSSSAAKKPAK